MANEREWPGRPAERPREGGAPERVPERTPERAPEGRGTPEKGTPEGRADREGGGARSFFGNEVPEQNARRSLTRTQKRVLGFTWMGAFSMLFYALFMILTFFAPGYTLASRITSIFLILGILFILMHGMGYANSMIKASWGYDEVKRRAFAPQTAPKVACVVATYNEPGSVLEETVAALTNLDYPNKEVIILDDSTNEESRIAAQEIATRYNVLLRRRTNRRGYKGGAINDFIKTTDAPFLAVFDADALPAHNFLRDLVPMIEENPRLAFVQTPQYYANSDVSNVALAASRQQSVFYEYICEGKNYSRAAFCCGTNVIFRRDVLLDVGGFDEGSVTEDFATSLNMHLKDYDSTYYNQVYAYSLAPETLGAYFTQQARWAFGSVGSFGKVVKTMVTRPGALRAGQWWEYFLSSSYYWIGWVNFIFMLLPLLYIFFGVQPLRADVFTYLAIFIPYLLFTMNMFYMGMEQRGYGVSDMVLGQQINFLCFPIHMTSALSGILGFKRPFGVTPKASGGSLNWLSLWPQLLMLLLSGLGFVYGTYYYFTGRDRATSAMAINAIWALYHVFILSGVFRLNRAVTHTASEPYFAPSQGRLQPATAEGATSAAGTGTAPRQGVLRPTGRFSSRTHAPLRHVTPPGLLGHMALAIGVFSVVLLLACGLTMFHWAASPTYPVNVYVLDRTTGRDDQEHRALDWTLNFLKVRKDSAFGPAGDTNTSTRYNFASDFYGFVPGNPANAVPDQEYNPKVDLKVGGENRPLPTQLDPKGALWLADTYGEFVEYDYHKDRYVHYVSEPRGLKPDDVDRVQDFYNGKGLLIGEWNTLGYPTLPAEEVESASLQDAIKKQQDSLNFLVNTELKGRQDQLKKAIAVKDQAWQLQMEQQIRDTQKKISDTRLVLKSAQDLLTKNADLQLQFDAQRRLEQMLHVHYLGWYGRYVDHFEQEHEYDFRLWKNVRDYIHNSNDAALKKQFPNDEPRGPGFVFYHDGASKVLNTETGKLEDNPFSKPVVIFQNELNDAQIANVAGIYRNLKPDVVNDPLLQGVDEEVPCRYWFDVVQAGAGSRVLAYYKLQVKETALQRLRAAKFPDNYLKPDAKEGPQIVFPASVVYRDGDKNAGELRSVYFAGDASDYPLVSHVAEAFPATGGIFYFLGNRAGSFSTQYYWNYYQPLVKNIFETTKRIRHEDANGT